LATVLAQELAEAALVLGLVVEHFQSYPLVVE
jgi:hypothetical protein